MMALPGTPVYAMGRDRMEITFAFPCVIAPALQCSGHRTARWIYQKVRSQSCRLLAKEPYGFEHVNVAQQRRDPDPL